MWGSVRLFGGHEISVTSRLRPVWFPSAWKTILAWIICASNTFMYTNFSPDDLYGLLSILSGLILSKSKLKVAVLSSRFFIFLSMWVQTFARRSPEQARAGLLALW